MSQHQIEIINDVDIKDLKPYPQNAFDHTVNINEIANSIRDFGYNKVSIGVDEKNVLLYGHGTLAALRLLGWKRVPMISKITGLTEDQKRCYRIADNTSAYNSKIIAQMIKQELQEQQTFDFSNYGTPMEYLFDIDPYNTTKQVDDAAEQFNKDNPNFVRAEKLWMYVEFRSKEEWESVIRILGKNRSRRILDTEKFMEVINAYVQSEFTKTENLEEGEIPTEISTD